MSKFFEMFGFEPNEPAQPERKEPLRDLSNPPFGPDLVPIAVYVEERDMRNHAKDVIDKNSSEIEEKLREAFPDAEDDEIKEKSAEFVQFSRTLEARAYNFCVVAHDQKTNFYEMYGAATHILGDESHHHKAGCDRLSLLDKKNEALMVWEKNISTVRYAEQPGTQTKELQFKPQSLDELSAVLTKEGLHSEFMLAFPATQFAQKAVAVEVSEELAKELGLPKPRVVKKQEERAELVKKYGEKNIRALEESIKKRQHEKGV